MATNQQLSKVQQDRLDILVRAGLKMAGFKPSHLRRAHQADVEALDAVRVRRSHNRDGEEVRREIEPDHNVRLLAARAIKQMIPGMFPSQGAGQERDAGNTINVQIVLQNTDGTQHVVQVATTQLPHNASVEQTIEQQ